MAYFLLKFIHITAAMFWIGSVLALAVLNISLVRSQDKQGLVALAKHSEFLGSTVIGPSAFLTLVAGVAMVFIFNLGMPFWIVWGFTAALISMGLGTTLINRAGVRLGEVAASPGSGKVQLQPVLKRLTILNMTGLLLLLSAVWVMVFKPVL